MVDHSFVTVGDGVEIAYRFDGLADGTVLVLSNSIGTTMRMWDGVVADLGNRFRILRYDTRGHGLSGSPAGDYSVDRLGKDVVELLDALRIDRAHFCGLSLGGFIGQWLGVHAPHRVDHLILANTSAYLGPTAQWDEQIATLRTSPDIPATARRFLDNWFPEALRDTSEVDPFREDLLAVDPRGLAGCFAAVRDADLRRLGPLIPNPTLVITGDFDEVCLPSHGELIAATVPNATLVGFPVVHLVNVEQPALFVETVLRFLTTDR
ncbi:putative hydrolase [Gordonia effusa NBRC 100432]|uniref:Putative hydrolase n=1 Tax=Gordonia effusa NBRC 100432 TaxID=1077974 RepID=H0QWU4_9ACTN|nr:alpha/beta fold hydrolase [Gordonia effusa]GAB17295.1 putative hydrolase [Gordonia effusa NBRC 100432]